MVALHLPIGPLKTFFELESLPRCEPSTYQPISRRQSHCTIGADYELQQQAIFYMHSPIHKIVHSMERKEGNVLFNDALNTFYLRLYGIRHMVKDHSDSEKGNPLPPHRLLFPINSKGSFICTIPCMVRIAHTTAFVTPAVVHWLERDIAQWVHPMKDRPDDPSHHERTLLQRSYISLYSAWDT